jgi:hypothetical protein
MKLQVHEKQKSVIPIENLNSVTSSLEFIPENRSRPASKEQNFGFSQLTNNPSSQAIKITDFLLTERAPLTINL